MSNNFDLMADPGATASQEFNYLYASLPDLPEIIRRSGASIEAARLLFVMGWTRGAIAQMESIQDFEAGVRKELAERPVI